MTHADPTPEALVERLRAQTYGTRPKPRPSPEALRATAEYDHKNAALWRAAADRIEALERENERRGEILRLCVERHDAFLVEQTPLIAARMKDAFDAARAFLARIDKEGNE